MCHSVSRLSNRENEPDDREHKNRDAEGDDETAYVIAEAGSDAVPVKPKHIAQGVFFVVMPKWVFDSGLLIKDEIKTTLLAAVGVPTKEAAYASGC